jgi:hypothetical protein
MRTVSKVDTSKTPFEFSEVRGCESIANGQHGGDHSSCFYSRYCHKEYGHEGYHSLMDEHRHVTYWLSWDDSDPPNVVFERTDGGWGVNP